MEWLVVAILTMLRSGVFGAALHHSDICVWRSSISPTLPPFQEAYPRRNCREGHVLWYYPHGQLRVLFRAENQQSRFTVCVDPESFIYMDSAISWSNDIKENRYLNMQATGDICTPSDSEGVVNLTFTSSITKETDLSDISYHIHNPS